MIVEQTRRQCAPLFLRCSSVSLFRPTVCLTALGSSDHGSQLTAEAPLISSDVHLLDCYARDVYEGFVNLQCMLHGVSPLQTLPSSTRITEKAHVTQNSMIQGYTAQTAAFSEQGNRVQKIRAEPLAQIPGSTAISVGTNLGQTHAAASAHMCMH